MHMLVFGDRRQAEVALQRFHTVHERIKGQLTHTTGQFPAGTSYHGNDPHLKLWVAATLVDTNLVAYKQFVGELTLGQQQGYYEDVLVLARLLGIPKEILPPSLAAFRRYVTEMLDGDTLLVTSTARRLARDVLEPKDVGILSGVSARLLHLTTAGLLPPRFRESYRLRWNRRRQRQLSILCRTTQWLRPRVPRWVWQNPLLKGKLARTLIWGMMASNSVTKT
jgi:uncharacterized protein (DUF2236 family)